MGLCMVASGEMVPGKIVSYGVETSDEHDNSEGSEDDEDSEKCVCTCVQEDCDSHDGDEEHDDGHSHSHDGEDGHDDGHSHSHDGEDNGEDGGAQDDDMNSP